MELEKQEQTPKQILDQEKIIEDLKLRLELLTSRVDSYDYAALSARIESGFQAIEEKFDSLPNDNKDVINRIDSIEKENSSLMLLLENIQKEIHPKDYIHPDVLDRVQKLDDRISSFTDVELEPTDIGCKNFFQEFLKARNQGFARADAAEKTIVELQKRLTDLEKSAPEGSEAEVNANIQLVGTMANKLHEMENRLNDLHALQSHKLQTGDYNSDAIIKQFDNLDKQILATQKNAIVLTQAVADMKVELEALKKDMTNKPESHTDNIANMESVRNLEGNIMSINAKIQDLGTIVDKLNKNSAPATSVVSMNDSINDKIGALEARLDQCCKIVDSLSVKVESFTSSIPGALR